RRARTSVVQVKSASGVLTVTAAFAQLIGDRRREPLRLAHAPAYVEAGKVRHRKRAHREAEIRQGGVDILRQRALKQQTLGLDRSQPQHPVADETVAYADDRRDLAELAADRDG